VARLELEQKILDRPDAGLPDGLRRYVRVTTVKLSN
jgi:hypothetical protein